MNTSIEKQEITIRDICPFCQKSFKAKLTANFKEAVGGITQKKIKPHQACQEFYVFIDSNGTMRAYQCIDETEEKLDQPKYNEEFFNVFDVLFEDPESLSEFSYVIDLNHKKNLAKAVITSEKIRYHQFLRSPDFKQWILSMIDSKKRFDYLLSNQLVVICANLQDKYLLALGIDQHKLGIMSDQDDISIHLKNLKNMAYKLGLKLLMSKKTQ